MSQPVSSLPSRARVVVIGGGIIGTSIAYHLGHLGWTDTVLIERDQLTSGTTWHAAGLMVTFGSTSETSTELRKYTRDLYTNLEAETGLATGFKPVGFIELAADEGRLEEYRRVSTFNRYCGVDVHELSPREVADMFPLARTDDLLAGFYVAEDGRVNPVDVTMSMAKGARQTGVQIAQGVSVIDVLTRDGAVCGVVTDHGTIECEYVVNAAGMWARQLGARSGVSIPLQAAEHYYLITEHMEGLDPSWPVIEDPGNYGYYREEVGGLMIGLFEKECAPWNVGAIPADSSFTSIQPDWDRMGPYVEAAMSRVPKSLDTGIRTFFCGPESFTPDLRPIIGPAPEVRNYFVAAGLNSMGVLLGGGVGHVIAHWIVDGVPPIDITGYAIDRTATYETSRRFRAERTVEQLGVLFGDGWFPTYKPKLGRNIRRSVVHDRHVAAGGHFNSSFGWEFAEWFDGGETVEPNRRGFHRQPWHEYAGREHRAVRGAVGVLDMSLMAKLLVQGPAAAAVLSRLSANDVDREVGRIVYTQWLDTTGGIAADVTVTRLAADRFMVVASDIIHRRIEPMIRRETQPGEVVVVTDVTSATTLLSVQGPLSRALLARLTDADLSNAAFPYLTAQQVHVGYAPVLMGRVTYVGELGYELHIPTEYALGVYDDVLAGGREYGIRPVGLAAMASLRLEKGYRDMGVDIDNTDNPIQAGLGFAVAWDKPGGFVGREALLAARAGGAPTQRVVGVVVDDADADLFGGEPVLLDGEWVGYVRAAAFGHTLDAPVGLAQVTCATGVTADWLRYGRFHVATPSGNLPARLQLAPLYDPQRLRILAE